MYLHNGLNDCISSPFICTNFSRLYQFNVQCCPGISYVCVLVFDKRSLLTTAKETRWHSPPSPKADYDKVLKLNHICEKENQMRKRDWRLQVTCRWWRRLRIREIRCQWIRIVRWPTTVTSKPNAHSKLQSAHIKFKSLTSNSNRSHQIQIAHSKFKSLTANYKSLTANYKSLTANYKSLTANSNHSQQITNRSQQIQIAHSKFKSFTAN